MPGVESRSVLCIMTMSGLAHLPLLLLREPAPHDGHNVRLPVVHVRRHLPLEQRKLVLDATSD